MLKELGLHTTAQHAKAQLYQKCIMCGSIVNSARRWCVLKILYKIYTLSIFTVLLRADRLVSDP